MINLGEVDGIPAVYTEAGTQAAGLVFRVGYGDEMLSRHGITHLIEHLALHRLGGTDYHFNGTTAPYFTSFFTQGTPEVAAAFLSRVCADLQSLPLDRLDVEKGVLRTEAESRGDSVAEQLLGWRFGTRGPGLHSFPEWGLRMVDPMELRVWVSRYFTRENAVLWFSGMTPPRDLRLPLSSGRREPLPPIYEALPETPAFFPQLGRQLGYHHTAARSTAAQAYAAVLQREMFQRMRQDAGLGYTMATNYEPLDAQRAAITAVADIAEGQLDAAVGEFTDLLAALKAGSFDPAGLDEVKSASRTARERPDTEAAMLASVAQDLLVGRECVQLSELVAELDAVTVADIQAVAVAAAPSGLLLVPRGISAEWAGFSWAPGGSADAVVARPSAALDDPERTLLIGTEGVSIVRGSDKATVFFGDCQAMLAWPDGARALFGSDGVRCVVEPNLYALAPGAMQSIDQHITLDRVVHMPARAPQDIPQRPNTIIAMDGSANQPYQSNYQPQAYAQANPQPVSRKLGTGGTVAVIIGIVVLSLVTALAVLVAVSMLVPTPVSDPAVDRVISGVFWVIAGLSVAGIVGLALLLRRC